MDKQQLAILYSFYNVLGTSLAALGVSDIPGIRDWVNIDLSIVGNAFQAAGSAASATLSTNTIEISSDVIQATGNSLVIYSLIRPADSSESARIGVVGNWFQALGGSYALQLNLQSDDRNLNQALTVTGSLMQVIGNALQALSGAWGMRFIEDKKRTAVINTSGSWIQALGAFIAWLALVRQRIFNTLSADNIMSNKRVSFD